MELAVAVEAEVALVIHSLMITVLEAVAEALVVPELRQQELAVPAAVLALAY